MKQNRQLIQVVMNLRPVLSLNRFGFLELSLNRRLNGTMAGRRIQKQQQNRNLKRNHPMSRNPKQTLGRKKRKLNRNRKPKHFILMTVITTTAATGIRAGTSSVTSVSLR